MTSGASECICYGSNLAFIVLAEGLAEIDVNINAGNTPILGFKACEERCLRTVSVHTINYFVASLYFLHETDAKLSSHKTVARVYGYGQSQDKRYVRNRS